MWQVPRCHPVQDYHTVIPFQHKRSTKQGKHETKNKQKTKSCCSLLAYSRNCHILCGGEWQKDFNMHVHSNDDENIKMHENLVTIILMSYTLIKLYVDIKFDVFNLKFRNHLANLHMGWAFIFLFEYKGPAHV
jgi:hypothetical protein